MPGGKVYSHNLSFFPAGGTWIEMVTLKGLYTDIAGKKNLLRKFVTYSAQAISLSAFM